MRGFPLTYRSFHSDVDVGINLCGHGDISHTSTPDETCVTSKASHTCTLDLSPEAVRSSYLTIGFTAGHLLHLSPGAVRSSCLTGLTAGHLLPLLIRAVGLTVGRSNPA